VICEYLIQILSVWADLGLVRKLPQIGFIPIRSIPTVTWSNAADRFHPYLQRLWNCNSIKIPAVDRDDPYPRHEAQLAFKNTWDQLNRPWSEHDILLSVISVICEYIIQILSVWADLRLVRKLPRIGFIPIRGIPTVTWSNAADRIHPYLRCLWNCNSIKAPAADRDDPYPRHETQLSETPEISLIGHDLSTIYPNQLFQWLVNILSKSYPFGLILGSLESCHG